jgi:hypothetical protein
MQKAAERQATPCRSAPVEGLGVGWVDQEMPFQRAAKALAFCAPTATQSLAETHDTSSNPPNKPLFTARLGVRWSDQRVPFQRSARVTPVPLWLVRSPTVVQATRDVHETPSGSLSLVPAGRGIASSDQRFAVATAAAGHRVTSRQAASTTALTRALSLNMNRPTAREVAWRKQ